MKRDFQQIGWDEAIIDDCRQIVRLAVREDLERQHDWTTVALVPETAEGGARFVVRTPGVIAGLRAVELAIGEMNARLDLTCEAEDGDRVEAGRCVATVRGSTRDLLTCERIMLNLLGRLSGIATLTQRYVEAAANHRANIYDTRKTTPGWRRLEKYAVACGGGRNHRTGLFDAILIKDNHLATRGAEPSRRGVGEAVRTAHAFLSENRGSRTSDTPEKMPIEVEVDTLEQLEEVLGEKPDIVLLDNMSLEELRQAVARRDAVDADIQLEASGGVTLERIPEIAATQVDRISVGALTHSAMSLDIGLDWLT